MDLKTKYTSITATSNGFILLNNPLQPPKTAGIYHFCTTSWEGKAPNKSHFGSKVTTILSYLYEKLALVPCLAHLYELLQDRFIPNRGLGKEKQLCCPGSAAGGRGRLVRMTPPTV